MTAQSDAVIVAICGALAIALVAMLWFRRTRPRKCRKCGAKTRRLGEKQEDAHLAKEAIIEEELGSIDYDVWLCDKCGDRVVVSHPKRSSGHAHCPKCHRRTLTETSKKKLKAATYSSAGEEDVTWTCKNCGYTKTTREIIPVLVRESAISSGSSSRSSSFGSSGGSSSGFSGGSSFGGGSSGGGGAGRSY